MVGAAAVLLRRALPPGVAATVSVVLWVVSGLSSIGTGLVPLDRDLALHSLLSLPVFLAQPVAIITLGVAMRGRRRAFALVVGVVSLVGTALFLALTGSPEFGGLAERLAPWPGYLWLPLAAWRIGLRHGV